MLSISLSADRVNFLLIEKKHQEIHVLDVDTILRPVDFLADNSIGHEVISEMHRHLKKFRERASSVKVSLPSFVMPLQVFPIGLESSSNEVRELINLEILQNFPEKTLDEFEVKYYSMQPKLDGNSLIISTFLEKKLRDTLINLFLSAGFLSVEFHPEIISSLRTLCYSHSDALHSNTILVCANKNTVEIIGTIQGRLAYISNTTRDTAKSLCDICEEEVVKVLSGYTTFIDSLFMVGESLSPSDISFTESKLLGLVKNVRRLNSFVHCTTSLDERHIEYGSRLAHVFAPCLGNVLPEIHVATSIITTAELSDSN